MNTSKVTSTLLLAALVASATLPAVAGPICKQFLSVDGMPKKYKRISPVVSSDNTGWIFTDDQFDNRYALNDTGKQLLSQITEEFEKKGVALAIVMPPPRPLVAGPDAIEASMTDLNDFDAAKAEESFTQMVKDAQAAGAIAPDLLAVARETQSGGDQFYFLRDTHWTPLGVAKSAEALARDLSSALGDVFPADLGTGYVITEEMLEERGSLSDMARATCEAELPPEVTAMPAFETGGGDLFADNSDAPRIALAGSSFSDRYNRDFYRVADAIAGATGASVDNFSVSGGGAIGAIEAIVLSGVLDQGDYDVVIWELPYTDGLRPLSSLRQLLGALRLSETKVADNQTNLDVSGETRVELDATAPEIAVLHIPEGTAERVTIEIEYNSGKNSTIKLVRKKRVPAELRSDLWALSLEHTGDRKVVSLTAKYDADAMGTSPKFELRSLQ